MELCQQLDWTLAYCIECKDILEINSIIFISSITPWDIYWTYIEYICRVKGEYIQYCLITLTVYKYLMQIFQKWDEGRLISECGFSKLGKKSYFIWRNYNICLKFMYMFLYKSDSFFIETFCLGLFCLHMVWLNVI